MNVQLLHIAKVLFFPVFQKFGGIKNYSKNSSPPTETGIPPAEQAWAEKLWRYIQQHRVYISVVMIMINIR